MSHIRGFFVVAAVALVAGLGLSRSGITFPPHAEASQTWVARLATDGGATGATQVYCNTSVGNTLQIQNLNDQEYAYKTCPTVTCAASATTSYRPMMPITTTTYNTDGGLDGTLAKAPANRTSEPIEMGLDKCINVTTLDAGVFVGNLFLLTSNLKK